MSVVRAAVDEVVLTYNRKPHTTLLGKCPEEVYTNQTLNRESFRLGTQNKEAAGVEGDARRGHARLRQRMARQLSADPDGAPISVGDHVVVFDPACINTRKRKQFVTLGIAEIVSVGLPRPTDAQIRWLHDGATTSFRKGEMVTSSCEWFRVCCRGRH